MRQKQSSRPSRNREHDSRLTGCTAAILLLEDPSPRPNGLALPPNNRRRPVPRVNTNKRGNESLGNHRSNEYQPARSVDA